ncbi:endonuclease domain-containing protein [Flavobacterium pedocola]
MDKVALTSISTIIIYRNFVENLPYNPSLKERARNLRKIGNFSEVVFWKEVHRKKFHNIDFDRQRIIGNYIVDFYVKALGLVVEIDGTSHNGKEDYDKSREEFLISCGLKVFRTTDFRVLHDLENVLKNLEDFIIKEYS